MDATQALQGARIVPVVVMENVEQAMPLAETLLEAGIRAIEITLRTEAALDAIEAIATGVPGLLVGAGSIRRAHQFEQVKAAGARFAVSPGSSGSLLDAAAKASMPFVPGAVTASEIIKLQEQGYSLVKFFPAELSGGAAMIKSLGAPLPEARFFPTGGITAALASEYLALPSVVALGGTWIATSQLLLDRDYHAIRKLADEAVQLTLP